jgi:hypothetical protein
VNQGSPQPILDEITPEAPRTLPCAPSACTAR